MKTAIMQIGKKGFQENNFLSLKNTILINDQIRLKFFKTSGKIEEIENIGKEIKERLEKDIKKKIIIRKIGFTLIINKLRKKAG